MKTILVFLSLLIFVGCRSGAKDAELKATFDKEIQNRLGVLRGLSQYDDSLGYYSAFIHEEFNRLILLSKDVENLSACVNKSNAFFGRMEDRFVSNDKGFTRLHGGLAPAAIELLLKENELFILNQIIFANSGVEIQMFSAKDQSEN